jgi:UPF0755 protein
VIAGLIASLVIIVALGGGAFYLYRAYEAKYHPANFTGDGHGSVGVHVPVGATATSLAPTLVSKGVVASARAFVLAAKASTAKAGLEPGYFTLHKGMSAALAYQLLINSSNQLHASVLIREGLRVSNVVDTLVKDDPAIPRSDYLQALRDPASLGLPSYAHNNPEGYLFPATYDIPPHTSAIEALRGMVTKFKTVAQIIDLRSASKTALVSEGHIIIVASLIEAEGGRYSDYPKIAEVIYNRLNHNIKLQLDSTVLFALGKYGIQATDQELQTPSAYNTYLHTGLPPGPIDNPGEAAIEAALHPAHGDLMYFVTVDPKKHITKFTASEAQFEQFEAELAKNIKDNT